jgi:hypothetical protein
MSETTSQGTLTNSLLDELKEDAEEMRVEAAHSNILLK